MKILMMTHHIANGGGSYTRVYALAKALVERGHAITLLASSHSTHWREGVDAGIRMVESPGLLPKKIRHGGLDFTEVRARLRFLERERFDLIHGFGHRPSVAQPALSSHRRHRTPYVVDWADLWGRGGIADERGVLARFTLGEFDEVLEREVNRKATGLTLVCRDLYDRAAALGIHEDKLHMLPVGASIEAIRVMDQDAMRAKHGLPPDAHIAVFSGYAPYDADLLGRAFVEMAQHDPQAHLLVTGSPPRQLLDALNAAVLHERVTIAGVVAYEQLGEYLACGDVMLLPYTDRGVNRGRSPGKLGDYLAAGKPVITNPTGDIAALIRSEEVGVLVDETAEAFASAALALFKDAETRQRLGRNARRTAETKLDWRLLAAELEQFYERMV